MESQILKVESLERSLQYMEFRIEDQFYWMDLVGCKIKFPRKFKKLASEIQKKEKEYAFKLKELLKYRKQYPNSTSFFDERIEELKKEFNK